MFCKTLKTTLASAAAALAVAGVSLSAGVAGAARALSRRRARLRDRCRHASDAWLRRTEGADGEAGAESDRSRDPTADGPQLRHRPSSLSRQQSRSEDILDFAEGWRGGAKIGDARER